MTARGNRNENTQGADGQALPASAGSATCATCKYSGREFEHLRGHKGIAEWRLCNAPLPFWDIPEAAPILENPKPCAAHSPNTKSSHGPDKP